MELPYELRMAIENEIEGNNYNKLMTDSQNITSKYKNESGRGKRLITSNSEAVTYSVVRMPATYGAVFSALNYTLDFVDYKINSLLDVGAGTGAASWAADSLINLKNVTCIEREDYMREVGSRMMKEGSEALSNAKWVNHDIISYDIEEKSDLVIESYMLNELTEENRLKVAEKLYNASNKITLFVEPGTITGSSNLMKIRDYLISKGAHILAPCPHEGNCSIEDKWCHFSCRIQRSRLHLQIKQADVPYEDEKFAYLAVTHEECKKAQSRVLRHPIIGKGKVSLHLCSEDGINDLDVYKRTKDFYKKARKASWGDQIDIK